MVQGGGAKRQGPASTRRPLRRKRVKLQLAAKASQGRAAEESEEDPWAEELADDDDQPASDGQESEEAGLEDGADAPANAEKQQASASSGSGQDLTVLSCICCMATSNKKDWFYKSGGLPTGDFCMDSGTACET